MGEIDANFYCPHCGKELGLEYIIRFVKDLHTALDHVQSMYPPRNPMDHRAEAALVSVIGLLNTIITGAEKRLMANHEETNDA